MTVDCHSELLRSHEEVGYSEFLAAMMSSRIQVHEDLVRAAFQPYDQDDSGFISAAGLNAVILCPGKSRERWLTWVSRWRISGRS